MVGHPKGSYMGIFYLKWRWALNQEITDSAAQQGWCPGSAACNSWCIHHPAVCDGRMCTAVTGAGRADGPIWLQNSPKQGQGGLAALSSWYIHPPPPAADEGHMTNIAAMPVESKSLSKFSSLESIDRWP